MEYCETKTLFLCYFLVVETSVQAPSSNPPSVVPSPSSVSSQDRTTPNMLSSPSAVTVTQEVKQRGDEHVDTPSQPSANTPQLHQQQQQTPPPILQQQPQGMQQQHASMQQQQLQQQQQQLQQQQIAPQQLQQIQIHQQQQMLQKFQQMQQQQQQQQQRQSIFHQQPILPKQQLPPQQQPSGQLQAKHISQPQMVTQRMQTSRGQGRSSSPGTNIRMATSPRDQSPGVASSHGTMTSSTASSIPMYMSSPNYPSVISSNRPILPSPGMYSTPTGQVPSSTGYAMNQPTGMQGMQYAGQRSGMPPNSPIPNRPPMGNYSQSFSSQPPAYSAQRFPDSSAYPPGFLSSPGSQHPPSSN